MKHVTILLSNLKAAINNTINWLAPIEKNEKPAWLYRITRLTLTAYVFALPFIYDVQVPEVAGDIRWYVTHTMVLALCSLSLFAIAGKYKKSPLIITPRLPLISWCMLGLAITATISFIDTINPYRSWFFYKHFISFIGLFWLTYKFYTPRWTRPLLWSLCLPLIPLSIMGIIQFMAITDAQITNVFPLWKHIASLDHLINSYPQSAIPGTTFANKNLAASWTMMLLPLALYLFVSGKNIISQITSSSMLTLGIIFLIFSRSRASWLAFIASVFFLTTWLMLTVSKENKRTFIIPLIFFITGIMTIPAFLKLSIQNGIAVSLLCVTSFGLWVWLNRNLILPYVLNVLKVSPNRTTILRTMLITAGTYSIIWAFPLVSPISAHGINLKAQEQMTNISQISDLGPRVAYNINALAMIADEPLTGVGIGAYHTAYPKYHNALYPTPRNGYNIEARPQRTHNDLMQAFVEQGIPSGILHIMVFALTLIAAWKLSSPAGRKTFGFFPAFLATGITGMGINAIGDFPLQMPTAPALLFFLFGIMHAMEKNQNIQTMAGTTKYPLKLKKPILILMATALAVATVTITQDNYNRRQGAQMLKGVMGRAKMGYFDDNTLRGIQKSNKIYPWNARMKEFRGIVYMHHKGKIPLPIDRKIEVLRKSIKYDPYAANHKINLSGQLHKRIVRSITLGNENIEADLSELESLVPPLLEVADFSFHTWNIIGLINYHRGKKDEAIAAFIRAYELNPNDTTALSNLGLYGIKTKQK